MKPLTDKQKNVLKLIAEKIKNVGYPPTLQKLTDELGVSSKNAVLKHLTALKKKNYINKRKNNAARNIRILESLSFLDGPSISRVPLVKSIPTDSPLLAEKNVDRYLTIPQNLLPSKKNCFALKVQKNNIINAEILKNNLIIVHSTNSANNSDIVVTLISNETTIKRFMVTNNNRYLKPKNPNYSNIYPTEE